jgi:hypothetical protein
MIILKNNLTFMKNNDQIREELNKKFPFYGNVFKDKLITIIPSQDNGSSAPQYTTDREIVLSFFLSQRSQDIEEIKRWALKVKRSNVEKENRDSKLQSIGFNEALISLLSFLDSLK